MLPDIARALAEIIVLMIDKFILPGTGRLAQKYGLSTLGLQTGASIDARLIKIDAARASLEDALSAMDALKATAEQNKADLKRLERAIEKAEGQKADLSAELNALKQLSALDSDSVRRALRMPTRVDIWRERIIAFGFGIMASVVAAYLWELWIKPRFFSGG